MLRHLLFALETPAATGTPRPAIGFLQDWAIHSSHRAPEPEPDRRHVGNRDVFLHLIFLEPVQPQQNQILGWWSYEVALSAANDFHLGD